MTGSGSGYIATIVERVSFEDVWDKCRGGWNKSSAGWIFYGALTCWWTHDNAHLGKLETGIPCDPRGGVLLQTDDVRGFLQEAKDNTERYGKHGLRAFMAAHHDNCQVSETDERRTCMRTWDEYNDALDRLDAGKT